MNYKKIGLRDLHNLSDEFPQYTLGEVLYAGLRTAKVKNLSDLLTMSDEDLACAIRNSIEIETETEICQN